MVQTLQSKLFHYETIAGCEDNKSMYMFYLARDIIRLLNKVTEKGLLNELTFHEKQIAKKIQDKYFEEFIKKAC